MNANNFHLFYHKNLIYLYRIDSGDAFRINGELADLIQKMKKDAFDCAETLPSDVMDLLSDRNHESIIHLNQAKIDQTKNSDLSCLSLNVAQDCNMRCKYCYGNGGMYFEKGYMQFETAQRSIDWLVKNSKRKNISVTFFGGEPLLNFKLIKNVVNYAIAVKYPKSKHFDFSITTNGTIINREIINFLNDYEFSVTISFDGDKQIQNYNRPLKNGRNSYRLVKKNIRKFLKSRKGNALARATITSGNSEWDQISRQLGDTGFARFDYAPVTADRAAFFALSDLESERLCQDLERQAECLISDYEIKGPGVALRIWDMILSLKSIRKKYLGCGAGRSLMAVSSQGKIYPCHRFVGNKKFEFGVVDNFNYKEQNTFLDKRITGFLQCENCWARAHCGGGCLHDNYVYSGQINLPDPRFCRELKRRLEMAIYAYDILKLNNQVS